MKTYSILVVSEWDLMESSKDKSIEDIGIHDLKCTSSQINMAAGIVYTNVEGRRNVLKDRYGILE